MIVVSNKPIRKINCPPTGDGCPIIPAGDGYPYLGITLACLAFQSFHGRGAEPPFNGNKLFSFPLFLPLIYNIAHFPSF